MNNKLFQNLSIVERREILLNNAKALTNSLDKFLSDKGCGNNFGGIEDLNHCIGMVKSLQMMIYQLDADDIDAA